MIFDSSFPTHCFKQEAFYQVIIKWSHMLFKKTYAFLGSSWKLPNKSLTFGGSVEYPCRPRIFFSFFFFWGTHHQEASHKHIDLRKLLSFFNQLKSYKLIDLRKSLSFFNLPKSYKQIDLRKSLSFCNQNERMDFCDWILRKTSKLGFKGKSCDLDKI